MGIKEVKMIEDIVLEKLVTLLKTPKYGDDLAYQLQVSRRTLCRYLGRLSDEGHKIAMTFERPSQYFLLKPYKE